MALRDDGMGTDAQQESDARHQTNNSLANDLQDRITLNIGKAAMISNIKSKCLEIPEDSREEVVKARKDGSEINGSVLSISGHLCRKFSSSRVDPATQARATLPAENINRAPRPRFASGRTREKASKCESASIGNFYGTLPSGQITGTSRMRYPGHTSSTPHKTRHLPSSNGKSNRTSSESKVASNTMTLPPNRYSEREFLLHEDQLLVAFFTDLHPKALIPRNPQLRQWLARLSEPLYSRWEQSLKTYENSFQRQARLKAIEDHRVANGDRISSPPAQILERARCALNLRGGRRLGKIPEMKENRKSVSSISLRKRTIVEMQCQVWDELDDDGPDDPKVQISLSGEDTPFVEEDQEIENSTSQSFVRDYAKSTHGEDLLKGIPQFDHLAKHMVARQSCLRARIAVVFHRSSLIS